MSIQILKSHRIKAQHEVLLKFFHQKNIIQLNFFCVESEEKETRRRKVSINKIHALISMRQDKSEE